MSQRPSGVSLGKVRRGRGGHDLNLGGGGSRGGGEQGAQIGGPQTS